MNRVSRASERPIQGSVNKRMLKQFEHVTLGQSIRFGAGQAAANLAAEVDRLGAKAVMVIAGGAEMDIAKQVTYDIEVATWHSEIVMHVPIKTANQARDRAAEHKVDLLVSVGGGSTTGLAKSVALTTGIPIAAVPTTYAGSEATNVWGLTDASRKTTGVDDKVLPRTVIYDSELMLSLPVEMSVASGLNGMAHCIDSLWGPKSDPINATLAVEGIRALSAGLPKIVTDPQGVTGRDEALYGAYLSAVSFASAGSGLHHKMCHVLGGAFNLPHAQTHAIVLPYVLAFNAPYAPQAETRAAAAFGTDSALGGLQRLRSQVNAPKRLADYGFSAEGVAEATPIIMENVPVSNPRRVTEDDVAQMLHAALAGADPSELSREA